MFQVCDRQIESCLSINRSALYLLLTETGLDQICLGIVWKN